MHQAQNPLWLNLTFLGVVVALVVLYLRARRQKVPAPKPLLISLWVLAVVQLLLMVGIQAYDHWAMRRELTSVVPGAVAKVTVSRANLRREVTDPSTISNLLSALQSLKGTAAHHSYPLDPCDIVFTHQGSVFHYRVGRDSQRPDEFWVKPVDLATGSEGTELGRIHSQTFGALIEGVVSRPK